MPTGTCDGTCGANIKWSLRLAPHLDGTLILTLSGTGDMYDFGLAGPPWAEKQENISTVVIGKGITSVGNRAFSECGTLTGLSLPDSLTRIGDEAFSGCHALPIIYLPAGITSIGHDAADCCFKLPPNARHLRVTDDGRDIFWV